MSKAIGGYVRRGDRRYVPPPEPAGNVPRCERCHARLDLCVVSPVHLCKEFTWQATAAPEPVIAFPEDAGEFLGNMLCGDPEPGPPWTHTLVPPETLYRSEAYPDDINPGCYWPMDDAPVPPAS